MPGSFFFFMMIFQFITSPNVGTDVNPTMLQSQIPTYYSNKIVNIHQPVSQPGYGDYTNIKPMFMTPPPPVVRVNDIAPMTHVYTEKEIPINKVYNIISYPMHQRNMFNEYKFKNTNSPYMGINSPSNQQHEYNYVYGPQ